MRTRFDGTAKPVLRGKRSFLSTGTGDFGASLMVAWLATGPTAR